MRICLSVVHAFLKNRKFNEIQGNSSKFDKIQQNSRLFANCWPGDGLLLNDYKRSGSNPVLLLLLLISVNDCTYSA